MIASPDSLPIHPCPACGAPLIGRRGRLPRGYTSCGGCSLGRLRVLPEPSAAAALYGESYFAGGEAGEYPAYGADEPLHRRNARRVLDMIEPPAAEDGRLLDVGCGYGFLLDEGRLRGWQVTGVDISAHAREQARKRFGIEVAPDLAALPHHAEGFAAVTAVQLLHHDVDPDALVGEIAARMRPGALLALETLDRGAPIARLLGRRWPLPAAPWTIWLFDRRSLARILERHGLRTIAVRPARKLVSVRHLAGALASRRGSAREHGALGRRLGELALPYPFADNILVLARREGP